MSFARGVPNPISVVIKDISHACWRLSLIANPVATIVVNAVIGVVVVLTVVVVIWRVIVVIRTVVVVVLTIVVIKGRVFPASYLGITAARDKKCADTKESFHLDLLKIFWRIYDGRAYRSYLSPSSSSSNFHDHLGCYIFENSFCLRHQSLQNKGS